MFLFPILEKTGDGFVDRRPRTRSGTPEARIDLHPRRVIQTPGLDQHNIRLFLNEAYQWRTTRLTESSTHMSTIGACHREVSDPTFDLETFFSNEDDRRLARPRRLLAVLAVAMMCRNHRRRVKAVSDGSAKTTTSPVFLNILLRGWETLALFPVASALRIRHM